MRKTNWNKDWMFVRGNIMYMMALQSGFGEKVNLPHDYMITGEVTKEAPAGSAMGYYTEGTATYTKIFDVPAEWKGEKIYLHFDGVMMNAAVYVNGSLIRKHHYGYTPFSVDMTDYLYYGDKNRVMVTVNPSMQPNSRWYTGAGIYRDVTISHCNRIHVENDGIFVTTKEVDRDGDTAYLTAEVAVQNDTLEDHQVRVTAQIRRKDEESVLAERSGVVLVKAGKSVAARIPITVEHPRLWSHETPERYEITASLTDMGVFSVRPEQTKEIKLDEATAVFGIRTVSADAKRGLLINGEPVLLKGACIHHDNGLIGAVSLRDAERRRLERLKESGYNAVRMAHNPSSAVLAELCDEMGMYVFAEAFDAWGHAKQPGDYSQFFTEDWKEDLTSFILRDRNHPSILFWSTGNEVEERGGMGNGYAIADELASFVRSLDSSRLITNGLCSMWSGLDDKSMVDQLLRAREQLAHETAQNADLSGKGSTEWEERTEAFTNSLDVVGYNYMDNHYEIAGELYPERVIVGTESYPNQADLVWKQVERFPYVIGDFVWTGYDYIGEAGIGKSAFLSPDAPELKDPRYVMSSHASEYPWRLANDADYTITGELLPQGMFRRILWGSRETGLYVQDPVNFALAECVSPWGWKAMEENWNWKGWEGKPIRVFVYSAAETVELYLNDRKIAEKEAGEKNRYQAEFEITYMPGQLEAVSKTGGTVISKTCLETTKTASAIRLHTDVRQMDESGRLCLAADGTSLAYVRVEVVDEQNRMVTDAKVRISGKVEKNGGAGNSADGIRIAGAGSDASRTEDNYSTGVFVTDKGYGTIVLRSGYETEDMVLVVDAGPLGTATLEVRAE